MRKIITGVLTFILICSNILFAVDDYGNISDWAISEIDSARENGIVSDESILEDCGRDITRKEFATLVVNIYKGITEDEPEAAPTSTFTDTDDENILIAYKLDIIHGVGNDLFAPDDAVTRQEMAVMMKRAVDAMKVEFEAGDGRVLTDDRDDIEDWALEGVDFVSDNGFMTGDGINFEPLSTTPVEQAVAIVNRVFQAYYEPETNDVFGGYSIEILDEGMQVTYDNNDEHEIIVSFEKPTYDQEGNSYDIEEISEYTNILINPSKIYFIDGEARMWIYDLVEEECVQLLTAHGEPLNVLYYHIIEYGGNYGYIGVENYVDGKIERYVYDRDGEYLDELESLTDLDDQIDEIYKAIEAAEEAARIAKQEFAIQVTGSAVSSETSIRFEEEDIYFFSSEEDENHYTFVEDEVGYLNLWPEEYEDEAYCAPIGRVGSANFQYKYTGENGIYEVDLEFYDESGNAGIVFNLQEVKDGEENFYGYYVGVSPEDDTVIFAKSLNDYEVLEEAELDYDLKEEESVNLMVIKVGYNFEIYINGRRCITASDEDDSLSEDGGFGVRVWNSDVYFSNYTIRPISE